VGQSQEVTLPDKDDSRERLDDRDVQAKTPETPTPKAHSLRQVIVTQAVKLPYGLTAGAQPGDFDIVQKATLLRPDVRAAAKHPLTATHSALFLDVSCLWTATARIST
jgi:hypothetical protein